jgi:hypothetical protein
MTLSGYILRKSLSAIPLLVGVTFISFLLMVHFGPDKTGRSPRSGSSSATTGPSCCAMALTCGS